MSPKEKRQLLRTTPPPFLKTFWDNIPGLTEEKFAIPVTALMELANSKLPDDAEFTFDTVFYLYKRKRPSRKIDLNTIGKYLPEDGVALMKLALTAETLPTASRRSFIRETREVLSHVADTKEGVRSFPVQIWALIVAKGKIDTVKNSPFEMLRGVEVSGIRRCPICKKFFWAGRIDKVTCSPKCGGARRARAFRRRQKMQIKPKNERQTGNQERED